MVLVKVSMPVPKTWAGSHIANRGALSSVLPCMFRKQRMIFLWYGMSSQFLGLHSPYCL